jgi:hypothetical protein
MVDGFELPDFEFFVAERSLYDSVHIQYTKSPASSVNSISHEHTVGPAYVPIQEPITARIKPLRQLSDAEKSRVVMQRSATDRKEVKKVEWNNGWAKANFSELGSFQLLVDIVPPEIIPIGISDGANLSKSSRIVLTVKDDNGQFRNFRAELDSQWLRFTNDKGRNFIYNFDEKCPRGLHELKITVEDEAGNRGERVVRFRR